MKNKTQKQMVDITEPEFECKKNQNEPVRQCGCEQLESWWNCCAVAAFFSSA
jgi:hypothetical protein